MSSSQVTKACTQNNYDRIELEPCARCHCIFRYNASADMQDLPGSFIRSDHLTSGQIFELTFLVPKGICFDASRREEYDGVKHFFSTTVSSKAICKKKRLVSLKRTLFV